jgi:hypothetical protein
MQDMAAGDDSSGIAKIPHWRSFQTFVTNTMCSPGAFASAVVVLSWLAVLGRIMQRLQVVS